MQDRTLGEIAEFVGGQVRGDPRIRIRAAATLSHAGRGDISFLVNRKYEKQLENTKTGVVNNIPDGETVLGAPAIDAAQARRAYTMLPYLPQMRQDIRALQSQLEKPAAELNARPAD